MNVDKTQKIWCAVVTYVFVAIVKKELHLDVSPLPIRFVANHAIG